MECFGRSWTRNRSPRSRIWCSNSYAPHPTDVMRLHADLFKWRAMTASGLCVSAWRWCKTHQLNTEVVEYINVLLSFCTQLERLKRRNWWLVKVFTNLHRNSFLKFQRCAISHPWILVQCWLIYDTKHASYVSYFSTSTSSQWIYHPSVRTSTHIWERCSCFHGQGRLFSGAWGNMYDSWLIHSNCSIIFNVNNSVVISLVTW